MADWSIVGSLLPIVTMRDPVKRRESQSKYYQTHKDEIKRKNKLRGQANGWYESSRDQAVRKKNRSKWFAAKYASDPLKYRNRNAAHRRELKMTAVSKLGGECQCCRESGLEFLTIDHIHGDGGAHRRQLKLARKDTSLTVYREIRDMTLKAAVLKYQVLCWNCQLSKYFGGGVCSHKRAS